jgi:DNA-binding CsgD family transcriptional regulator
VLSQCLRLLLEGLHSYLAIATPRHLELPELVGIDMNASDLVFEHMEPLTNVDRVPNPAACSGACHGRHLTLREIDILLCCAAGWNAGRTGRRLGISRRTVEFHLSAMLRRTGAKSSTELVARCFAAGVIAPNVWPPQWSGQLCVPDMAGR